MSSSFSFTERFPLWSPLPQPRTLRGVSRERQKQKAAAAWVSQGPLFALGLIPFPRLRRANLTANQSGSTVAGPGRQNGREAKMDRCCSEDTAGVERWL